jgi:ribosome maturation factor RimP
MKKMGALPIFFCQIFCVEKRVQLRESIETIVCGLGYELVAFERIGKGLLRVFIEYPATEIGDENARRAISLEDCEKVSHQIHYALEVEQVDYDRLEVSSPGLDRPLCKWTDFLRFAGKEITLSLKKPLNGRKQYRGILQVPEGEAAKPQLESALELRYEGKEGPSILRFTLADLDRARLVPQVDFRSQKR